MLIKILSEVEGCPYCMSPRNNKTGCCSEVHFEPLYICEVDGKELSYYLTESELSDLKKDNQNADNSKST